jgi:molecular chaperone DnaK
VVDEILRRAGLTSQEIDAIILSGGQSRAPAIHRALFERFRKKPDMRVHPDHAVATGAALVAATVAGQVELTLIDLLPASIRLELEDGGTQVLLERGTALPARTRFEIEATTEEKAEFRCILRRGEHARGQDNEPLGRVRIPSSLAEAVSGATASVVVDVSTDGLLSLAMRHPQTGETQSLQMSLDTAQATTDEVDDLEITVAEE